MQNARATQPSLARYRRKRDFSRTAEPSGAGRQRQTSKSRALKFVVQRHAARRLHYDFRLELDGVLKSWAVPKGPSLDPRDKRLAVEVEDHPLEYARFEGTIPAGQYGAGEVVRWDHGTWTPQGDARAALTRGHLKFNLKGGKLRGQWTLVRLRSRELDSKHNWLLIKAADEEARRGGAVRHGKGSSAGARSRKSAVPALSKPQSSTAASVSRADRRTPPAPSAAPKRKEKAAAVVAEVTISHPQRRFQDSGALNKLDLALYYEAVSEWLLPHLARRPLALVRCPGGDFGACFFQRHAAPGIRSERAVPADADYLLAESADGVVELVQAGVIEFHTWGTLVPRIGRPDRITLDLDPDPHLEWRIVREACELVRALLGELELKAFVKTTGGKGMHIVVPLERRYDWDAVKDFSRAIASHLATALPTLFTANMAKARRPGRIFLDYLRNGEAATAVAAYSARARPGLPVSTPLRWAELKDDVRGAAFDIRNVPQRLRKLKRDPWSGYRDSSQRITARARRILSYTPASRSAPADG
jgi:bifunctional non-homologous end joining protein LigD